MTKPKIGIVTGKGYVKDDLVPYVFNAVVSQEYIEAIEMCGAIPVTIPVISDHSDIEAQLAGLDGLLLTGGEDIDPQLYGETPVAELGQVYPEVDSYYIDACHIAYAQKLPVFGICKGMQALNVAFGGTLYQDLKTQYEGAIKHWQAAPRSAASHTVECVSGSFVFDVLGSVSRVNSHHHQAIKKLGEGFDIVATAPDGVVEAIQATDRDEKIMGVQWHPEMMCVAGNIEMKKLLISFVDMCRD